MDKMLVAIMTILDMEGQVNTNKAIVKEINEFLAELREEISEKCLVVGGLESKWHIRDFFKIWLNFDLQNWILKRF